MTTILSACAAAGVVGGALSLAAGVKSCCRARLRKRAQPRR